MTPEADALPREERWARPLFLATVLAGSFLLFLTQPMVARMALPRLGGTPAVWNSAMLVYQALLLAGYAYAHRLGQLRPARQASVHLLLFGVAALWLPIGLSDAIPPNSNPAFWVPWFLLSSIGPLFFIVSAQAPLMQRWYALESARGEPYALYAASNLGSFAGLISYPLIVEPLLTLRQQSLLWTGGYVLLALLVAACASTVFRYARREEVAVEPTPAPQPRRIAHWIALAAVPSGLMLSTTTHLTTDIVAMPLLWVLPLGFYLLSFVVAFASRRGAADFITLVAPLIILIAGGLAFADGSRSPFFSATLGLSLLFVVSVALHGEMYRLRPAPDHLTGFYLAMAVGGMVGGMFCAVLAPLLFDWTYEHPILILAAALLLPQAPLLGILRRFWASRRRTWIAGVAFTIVATLLSLLADLKLWYVLPDWQPVAAVAFIAIVALLAIGRPIVFAIGLAGLMLAYDGWTTLEQSFEARRTRSYFGVYTITDHRYEGTRTLVHGTTLHGLQSTRPGEEREPTSYYGRSSGVGLAMMGAQLLFGGEARIGVVGLGTGTLACYAQPEQDWTFFEIDPAVVRISTEGGFFTFLSRCKPDARIVLGDARIQIGRQPAGSFDMLAVDAFSSDAVPMHLLTREAMMVYGRALQPDGLILFHISNRYLNLAPVLASNARAGGWHAAVLSDEVPLEDTLRYASVWVAMSRDPGTILLLQMASGKRARDWVALAEKPGFAGWTDDHATILPLLERHILPEWP